MKELGHKYFLNMLKWSFMMNHCQKCGQVYIVDLSCLLDYLNFKLASLLEKNGDYNILRIAMSTE